MAKVRKKRHEQEKTKKKTTLYLIINRLIATARPFLYLCRRIGQTWFHYHKFDSLTKQKYEMVTELIVVWFIGVVAFFALWAVLLKVIKRISEKKEQRKTNLEEKPTDLES